MKENLRVAEADLRVRLIAATKRRNEAWQNTVESKDEVLARFQPLFSLEHIPTLTEEEFKEFLIFKNNLHWSGLHRLGPEITHDIKRLRKALQILLDEETPLVDRLNRLVPLSGSTMIKKLNRAVITAVLHIAYPDKYGVWNRKSHDAMVELGVWPEFDRGESFGQRYRKVNAVMLGLTEGLGTDLWTLDYLWHLIVTEGMEPPLPPDPDKDSVDTQSAIFGLERYLQEFLRDNWDITEFGKEWSLYEEDGEVVGFEFNTGEIGRIDLLAKHRKENRWLVIELKRNQTSDDTVGQALRYMGWVKKNLAGEQGLVEGTIIAHAIDDKLRHALVFTNHLKVCCYEVDFRLRTESK